MDLKEEDILGDSIVDHWYYVSKGRALSKFLGEIKTPEILDVGAGSGIFSRQLLDKGQCCSAVCVDPNYVNEKTEIYHGKKINFVKSLNDCSHSLVLMMDVLEHVSDDLEFLKSYSKNMKSGGYVLITVPAFKFLRIYPPKEGGCDVNCHNHGGTCSLKGVCLWISISFAKFFQVMELVGSTWKKLFGPMVGSARTVDV